MKSNEVIKMAKRCFMLLALLSIWLMLSSAQSISIAAEVPKSPYSSKNDTLTLDIKTFSKEDSLNLELQSTWIEWGSYVGSFNGITAYSNGNWEWHPDEKNYVNGIYTGVKWQCVEYVQRYYLQIYSINIEPYMGNANSFYSNASSAGLEAYPNGGSVAPQVGDIICSNYSYGHVAIVREVGSSYIKVIHQNWSNTTADNSKTLTRNGNNIGSFSSSYTIVGWLRKPSQSGSLTVTNPQAGYTWNYASRVKVEWDYSGYSGNIAIDIYKGGEAPNQNQIRIVSSVPVSQRQKDIDLPTSLVPGTDYKVGISATPSGDPWDFSDFFAIRRLTVTYPNGGQTFNPAQSINVTWNHDYVTSNLLIDLYKGGTNQTNWVTSLVSNTPNDGSQTINLPSELSSGTDYLIAISGHEGYVWDFSDSYFTIQNLTPTARIDSYTPNDPNNPVEVQVGNSTPISVTFTNTGNTNWSFIAGASVWDVNWNIIGDYSKTISLGIGQQTTASWSHTVNNSGDYWLQFGIWKDSQTLLDKKPSPAQRLIRGVVPPVAEFTATPTSGNRPLTVQFTDQSTGVITSRSWNFGDGGTSSQQNPSHQYTTAGDFTVSLTVTGPGGSDTETKTNYIHVSEPAPVAQFAGNPTSGNRPLTVQFTDQSTGVISSRSWNFGDGGTSSQQNPSHQYTTAGDFTVSLTVTGPGGSDTETKTNYIHVSEPAPVATPTFSPPPGTYTSPQDVSISCGTPGATIRYTTNGNDPTESDPTYTSPIRIASTTTLKARAYKGGWNPSAVASGVYEITGTVVTPTFSPPPGTYTSPQDVSINCGTPGATIRYTTNGNDPTESDPTYTSPIHITSTTTLKARAYKSGWTPSNLASGMYEITGTVAINLNRSWNLVSWNVDTPNDSVSVVLSDIMANLIIALGFEKIGLTYDPQWPQFSNLHFVDHLHGYWLNLTAEKSFSLVGSYVSPSTPIELESGWNLVSYLPNNSMDIERALGSIMDKVIVVLGFDKGGLTYDPDLPQFSTLKILSPGFGYWIKVTEPCILIYPDT